jgi:uncharacterized cupredoxin-like copper-binding protein
MRAIKGSIAALAALAAVLAWTVPAGAHRSATVVTVTAGKPSEFGFKLSTKTVKHGAVTFKITNGGAIVHTFKICASPKGGSADTCKGKGTPNINPGSSATLSYTFPSAGKYEYLCTIAGHAAGGMKGVLKVT